MAVSARGSWAAGIVVLLALACLLLPLPTPIIDALLAANLIGTTLLLVTAATVRRPSELGSLPQWLIAASLARLVLAVSTVRLILTQGAAGQVIDGFGRFVVRGDYVVGLCIFIVLGLVQYLVLARGGERIAEVAARFALDALPGQQMALDAEVRGGQLSAVEGQRRRAALVGEAQLFGSLDGAMRFVRGDTIAGFLVLGLSLVAGLALGVWRDGLAVADAAKRYTLLTIGDGLVTQLPSLLVSSAAALIVSRASATPESTPLEEVLRPRAIVVAAIVSFALGAVPGLPLWPFWTIAVLLAALRWWLTSPFRKRPTVTAGPDADVVVRLPPAVATQQPAIARALDRMTERLSDELGLRLPPSVVRVDDALDGGRFIVDVHGLDVARGELRASMMLVDVAPAALPPGVAGEPATHPRGQTLASWIPESAVQTLGMVEALGPVEVVAAVVEHALRIEAPGFITIEAVHGLVRGLTATHPNLVREVIPKRFDVPALAEILRRLVREGLSVRRLDEIFDAAARLPDETRDADRWAEQLRAALRRQITARHTSGRSIDALLLDAEAEELLRESLRPAGATVEVALEPELHDALLQSVGQSLETGRRAVVVTPADLRRHVRRLLEEKYPALPVLAYTELLPDVTIQPIGNLTLRG